MNHTGKILVTGATGYVGGRLVLLLLEKGYKVRATSRSIEKLKSRTWAEHANIELSACDMLDLDSSMKTLEGCSEAYYFVHSMNPHTKDFVETDRITAKNFAIAAEKNNLKRIIYLGGLGKKEEKLSKHLKSRAEVAEILSSGKTPVTTLKAAMIIGSGSASFEILRYLVDRLPIIITPKWVSIPSQPIAIRNVLNYLIGCLENQETTGKTFDIGGKEIVTYRELFDIYAEEVGLRKRIIIPVPFFTPKISSYWIHLVTPVPAYIARPLAEGLRNPLVCRENEILKIIPQKLLSSREAIRLAIQNTGKLKVESHWSDAGVIEHPEWTIRGDEKWAGGTVYEDKRKIVIKGKLEELWKPIIKIGGETGYYSRNWMWEVRGILDIFFGGVGLKRGRKDPETLKVGDVLDFWRVVDISPPNNLLLSAEMKLPGKAFLEFQLKQIDNDTSEIIQTAKFFPKGVGGILYWNAIKPLHDAVFDGMLKGVGRATRRQIILGPKVVEG